MKKNHKNATQTAASVLMGTLAIGHVQADLIDTIKNKDAASVVAEKAQLNTQIANNKTDAKAGNQASAMAIDSYVVGYKRVLTAQGLSPRDIQTFQNIADGFKIIGQSNSDKIADIEAVLAETIIENKTNQFNLNEVDRKASQALTDAQAADNKAKAAQTAAQAADNKATAAQTAAQAADNKATAAQTAAQAADNKATAAQTAAQAADTKATAAQTAAQAADTKATAAQTAAQAADTKATAAQTAAQAADDKATAAQTTAQAADTKATDAQTTANTALSNTQILENTKADKTALASISNTANTALSNTQVLENTKADKADLDTLGNRVTTVENTVVQHGTDIANLNTQVARQNNQLTQINQRIDDLEDKTEKGLAAQAALTGLFQPYSIGKFNVSAAVGGYKSKVAIAVGGGYRFDEKTAIKAGIATSPRSGGAAYNVGVNYEW
ncbi:YadA-like C-terminal region [Alysiella filiformis DSM 16848]|uniref:YadA-like C-terminal region n=1 Tax=Alysiella filiformis DSM 16848 TaxID=1120981 RepID=A0A286E6L8_9NEIS|nr:YadA C-terminal domain-containing protein [Alysiella filiformis]SOD66521.1 YadA-like C-terminal region [Alysiella filiformis DSM 16848]